MRRSMSYAPQACVWEQRLVHCVTSAAATPVLRFSTHEMLNTNVSLLLLLEPGVTSVAERSSMLKSVCVRRFLLRRLAKRDLLIRAQ
jgi:hypothetical protein